MKTTTLGLPLPISPKRDSFDLDSRFEKGELSTHEIRGIEESVTAVVDGDDGIKVTVDLRNVRDKAEWFWAVVYWCRYYGVPGVQKEIIEYKTSEGRERLRLGALYLYAGFELTGRERNYQSHGETEITQDELNELIDEIREQETTLSPTAHAQELLNLE